MTNTELLNQATNTKITEKSITFKGIIAKKLDQGGTKAMMSLMPSHVNKDALIRTALQLASKQEFEGCNPVTFLTSYASAAQLGLQPNTALGHCYLLPFMNKGKKEVQLMLGYKGMIDIARRSDQIDSINSFVVYNDDEFNITLGLEPSINHVPNLDADRSDNNIKLVYAIAKLKGGGSQFEYLTLNDIAKARKSSQSANAKEQWQREKSPWNSHFAEMCRKSAIRKLFKYLPVSLEMANLMARDEKADTLDAGLEYFDDENTIDILEKTIVEATE
jgi:recombination protein RecT